MDISLFSSDNFDTKAWVNETLKNAENQENKKDGNYTISLATKLQLYVQQVNSSLEQTSQQVLTSLPKIMRDAKNLQTEVLVLRDKMAEVKEEIVKVERDTKNSIKTIETLDNMKNQLYAAKQGLHESDNWIVLVNDIEEVFESKNIESISNKIVSMQNSLKLLVNISDYEDRKLQLEGLKNRLEAIASPAIVQAFTTLNTEQSLSYVRMFSSIGRLPQLIKYYNKCQRDLLLKKWRNQLEIEQDESVNQWVHNYYNILLSNWHSQYKWFNQVFSTENATNCLLEIYTDVLSNLDPSLNVCIDAALKQTNDQLTFLKENKETTKEFTKSLINIIGHISVDKILQFLQASFSYFVQYVNKYSVYEQAYLSKQLTTLNCTKEELQDTIQSLNLTIPSVFDKTREAIKHCEEMTDFFAFCGLLVALRAFLLSYAGHYRVALRQIDRNRKYSEDWTTFQQCLSLLQNTGEVILKITQLEKDLTNIILDIDHNQKTQEIDYKYVYLNETDRKEYDSLVRCVSEGTQLSLLDHVTTEFNKLCDDIHRTTYEVVFAPIAKQLEVIESPQMWEQFSNSSLHNSDMPDYSFSPQEYITEIGQYFMTLPQHIEPFLFRENPSLTCALKAVNQEYHSEADVEGGLARTFLKIIAKGMCEKYCDKIMSISHLSQPASRQLSHDINYLNNILQDLGISLSENLQELSVLLKLPSDQYQTKSSGYSARFVAGVRQMRNITSN